MSRMFRSAATALLISLLACSSLPALPFAAWMPPDRGNVLTAIVEWIGSLFTGRTDSTAPDSAQPKEGSIMDPDGHR